MSAPALPSPQAPPPSTQWEPSAEALEAAARAFVPHFFLGGYLFGDLTALTQEATLRGARAALIAAHQASALPERVGE